MKHLTLCALSVAALAAPFAIPATLSAVSTLTDEWQAVLPQENTWDMKFMGDFGVAVPVGVDRLLPQISYVTSDRGLTWSAVQMPQPEPGDSPAIPGEPARWTVFAADAVYAYEQRTPPTFDGRLYVIRPGEGAWSLAEVFDPPDLETIAPEFFPTADQWLVRFTQQDGDIRGVLLRGVPGGEWTELARKVYIDGPQASWVKVVGEPFVPFGSVEVNDGFLVSGGQWTVDGITWSPLPTDDAKAAEGINVDHWPEGYLSVLVGLDTSPPFARWFSDIQYFGPSRQRSDVLRLPGVAALLESDDSPLLVAVSANFDLRGVYRLNGGAFSLVDAPEPDASLVAYNQQYLDGKYNGVYYHSGRGSYDLKEWVTVAPEGAKLVPVGDRILDTVHGLLSPRSVSPWPLATRWAGDWLEDPVYGWIYDAYYPWVYIYTRGDNADAGIGSGWFSVYYQPGWYLRSELWMWSVSENDWVWTSRSNWPRIWSFRLGSWMGLEQ